MLQFIIKNAETADSRVAAIVLAPLLLNVRNNIQRSNVNPAAARESVSRFAEDYVYHNEWRRRRFPCRHRKLQVRVARNRMQHTTTTTYRVLECVPSGVQHPHARMF